MNSEHISYREVVSEVKKHCVRGLLLSTGVAVTFMIIVLFTREGRVDFFTYAFAAVMTLLVLFGGVIPLLQMNSKLKKIQRKLSAETDADMDALLSDSTRIHPLCFLTGNYLISFQNMFVCDLQEIRCIQISDSTESDSYSICVQYGGLSRDYLNYQREAERNEAFRALMNAVGPECKVKNGFSTIR